MARSSTVIFLAFFISCLAFFRAEAQTGTNSYELLPAPDLWYNDVDGIRLGLRLKGQVPGTFEDGPHRLYAGLWLGLWFPENPVSYYISYTEPIPAWSDFGSEASIEGITSIRTGYSVHGLAFNKRWQQGFDERRFRELRVLNTYEKRYDTEYTAFPNLWSGTYGGGWQILSRLTASIQDENSFGQYNLAITGAIQYSDDTFGFGSLTAVQRAPFNDSWGMRFRGFIGVASDATAPEYLFSRSTGQTINTLQSGITRAKGTIPQPWMESGNFHFAGGANLRGYTSFDVDSFMANNGDETQQAQQPLLFRSIAAFNTEFDYPNPLKRLFNEIPYAADFLKFRSYLFFDAGTPLGLGDESTTLFADAGAGFSLSLNIPDYLGKDRGFVFRYDIPFWLSEPGTEVSFKFRSLFAFGAVISF